MQEPVYFKNKEDFDVFAEGFKKEAGTDPEFWDGFLSGLYEQHENEKRAALELFRVEDTDTFETIVDRTQHDCNEFRTFVKRAGVASGRSEEFMDGVLYEGEKWAKDLVNFYLKQEPEKRASYSPEVKELVGYLAHDILSKQANAFQMMMGAGKALGNGIRGLAKTHLPEEVYGGIRKTLGGMPNPLKGPPNMGVHAGPVPKNVSMGGHAPALPSGMNPKPSLLKQPAPPTTGSAPKQNLSLSEPQRMGVHPGRAPEGVSMGGDAPSLGSGQLPRPQVISSPAPMAPKGPGRQNMTIPQDRLPQRQPPPLPPQQTPQAPTPPPLPARFNPVNQAATGVADQITGFSKQVTSHPEFQRALGDINNSVSSVFERGRQNVQSGLENFGAGVRNKFSPQPLPEQQIAQQMSAAAKPLPPSAVGAPPPLPDHFKPQPVKTPVQLETEAMRNQMAEGLRAQGTPEDIIAQRVEMSYPTKTPPPLPEGRSDGATGPTSYVGSGHTPGVENPGPAGFSEPIAGKPGTATPAGTPAAAPTTPLPRDAKLEAHLYSQGLSEKEVAEAYEFMKSHPEATPQQLIHNARSNAAIAGKGVLDSPINDAYSSNPFAGGMNKAKLDQIKQTDPELYQKIISSSPEEFAAMQKKFEGIGSGPKGEVTLQDLMAQNPDADIGDLMSQHERMKPSRVAQFLTGHNNWTDAAQNAGMGAIGGMGVGSMMGAPVAGALMGAGLTGVKGFGRKAMYGGLGMGALGAGATAAGLNPFYQDQDIDASGRTAQERGVIPGMSDKFTGRLGGAAAAYMLAQHYGMDPAVMVPLMLAGGYGGGEMLPKLMQSMGQRGGGFPMDNYHTMGGVGPMSSMPTF